MSSNAFGHRFVQDLIMRAAARLALEERVTAGADAFMNFRSTADPDQPAGCLRLWAARSPLVDRMVHVRLAAEAVDTQLFFLFGRPETAMPHFHMQVVQFGNDACVYNADFLPRLDPVDHPDYFRTVMDPLNVPYWKAVNDYDNVCSHAPGNPAIAAYLSPWSIGTSRPSTRNELEKIAPSIHAYLDHWLLLAESLDYPTSSPEELRQRDARHLACFFDEALDRRAWRGVYGLIGEAAGREVRHVLQARISDTNPS